MLITDMQRIIEQVSREKGIPFETLVNALEDALRSAAKKKFGDRCDIEIRYNDDSGEIEVFQFKDVVDTVSDPDLEISLEEGRRLDPECEVGDSLGMKMDPSTFGRIATQSARQVLFQKLKAAERDSVYKNFVDKKFEIINGIVSRVTRSEIYVNLGQAEAVMSRRDQLPGEIYRRGDRVRALIIDVKNDFKGHQIILSRTHNEFLVKLFKAEVPEITEGLVDIVSVARDPGSRAKIAVRSHAADVDPVGACVGIRGSRVQNVVHELKGEKIDIIPWHMDPAKFVCSALAPASISKVIIDDANHSMEVIVPDDNLSIAIGRQGQNVRLASQLTGWRLDVTDETSYKEKLEAGFDAFMKIPEMTEEMANNLLQNGCYTPEDLLKVEPEQLSELIGIDMETANLIIENNKKIHFNRRKHRHTGKKEKNLNEEIKTAERTAKDQENGLDEDMATQRK